MSTWIDRQLSLQVAYRIADEVSSRPVGDLFNAMDRFWADRHLLTESEREQRSEAEHRLSAELDRRSIPLRDPAIEAAAIADIRARILPAAPDLETPT
ncbi:hypothetical protein [Sphingosinicella sp. BN140058]|uniref:hypothetical protein n=1 Tax=Sphingosinicella sp. BN140058 TaxID=1892855 RepID=UPI0010104F56|nr:hypothetical protein [Sphingosinicella sp. BN140058]QAY80249.1 hypothetical protein ETR14_26765 [Sphingosinicella sp. BN140058]